MNFGLSLAIYRFKCFFCSLSSFSSFSKSFNIHKSIPQLLGILFIGCHWYPLPFSLGRFWDHSLTFSSSLDCGQSAAEPRASFLVTDLWFLALLFEASLDLFAHMAHLLFQAVDFSRINQFFYIPCQHIQKLMLYVQWARVSGMWLIHIPCFFPP